MPLIRYSKGQLNPKAARHMTAHLGRCRVCAERLVVLVALGESRRLQAGARKRMQWLKRAAILLLVMSTPVLFRHLPPLGDPPDTPALAVNRAYPLVSLRNRSESFSESEAGYRAYEKGDYAGAEVLLRGSGAEVDLLARGVSLYLLDREREAVVLFRRIPPESTWKEPARWYEANAWIRLGEWQAARELLHQLSAGGGEHSKRAVRLLQELADLP